MSSGAPAAGSRWVEICFGQPSQFVLGVQLPEVPEWTAAIIADYDWEVGDGWRLNVGHYEPVPGATDHPYWSDEQPCSMHIDEVEAIWSRIDEADDWAPFHEKIKSVSRMGDAMSPPA